MRPATQRRLFQGIMALLSLVPIGFGLYGMSTGAAGPGEGGPPIVDNRLRFLYGLELALGVLMIAIVPRIERHGDAVRFIGFAMFVGGLGRLWSVLAVGVIPGLVPSMVVELVGVPLLVLWHRRLVHALAAEQA